uniref:protein SRC2 homolog n=1 Tax=Erigeron canadensis TaxID=72917 RepID=UPI001CB8C017|nr:protein SRC2 homolog [Erigeron canadensis]
MEYMTQYRTLDITLICSVLMPCNSKTGDYIYAVASLSSSNRIFYKDRTPVKKYGLKWNHPMKLNILESSAQKNQLTLVVKIKSVGHGLRWDKKIAEVKIPIKELLNGRATKQGRIYNVLGRYDEYQGYLKFTYEFSQTRNAIQPQPV